MRADGRSFLTLMMANRRKCLALYIRYKYLNISIIQTTRKWKLIKPVSMHLFYSASRNIKMVIFVDLSACIRYPLWIFGMPFQYCSVLFRDPSDLLLSCLSQAKGYRMLRSFVRTLPYKFHQLIWLYKTVTNMFI